MSGCAYRSRTQEPVEAYEAIREATRAWSRAAAECRRTWDQQMGRAS